MGVTHLQRTAEDLPQNPEGPCFGEALASDVLGLLEVADLDLVPGGPKIEVDGALCCLLYTSPSPRD